MHPAAAEEQRMDAPSCKPKQDQQAGRRQYWYCKSRTNTCKENLLCSSGQWAARSFSFGTSRARMPCTPPYIINQPMRASHRMVPRRRATRRRPANGVIGRGHGGRNSGGAQLIDAPHRHGLPACSGLLCSNRPDVPCSWWWY